MLSSKLTAFPLSSEVTTVGLIFLPIPNFILHFYIILHFSDLRLGVSFVVDSCLEIWIQSLPQFTKQDTFCLEAASAWGGLALTVYPRLDITVQFYSSLSLPRASIGTVSMMIYTEARGPITLSDSQRANGRVRAWV